METNKKLMKNKIVHSNVLSQCVRFSLSSFIPQSKKTAGVGELEINVNGPLSLYYVSS